MQIQTGSTLFDYLDDPGKASQTLQKLAENQHKPVAQDLAGLQQDLDDNRLDYTLEKIESGESSISLQTLDNMIAFHSRPASEDLGEMAERLGIKGEVAISLVDGKWQVEGADAEGADPAVVRLQQYLDANQDLQKRLDQLNRLSEFYEWGKTREYATELKTAGMGESQLVDYLKASREHLLGLDSFSLSSDGLSLQSRGQAESLYHQAREAL